MNIRQVLRTYSLLRQLTDDETALLETLRSLNDTERESLVVALQPEKVTTRKPTTERKIEHCVACDYTKRAAVHKDSSLKDYHEFVSAKEEKEEKKSKRAASLSGVIQRTPKVKVDDDDSDDPSRLPQYCFATVDDNGGEMTCGKSQDDPIHDLTYSSSHSFIRDSRTAARAGGKSSTNGGATNSTANSATEPEGVSNAVHAGG